ncbi:MAG TPA: alpha-glucan family phosphorylase [Verrucomicrobiae bacterium]|jgi:starch phosphorylase|nr:alpha-glucan family phosphorylase [Verrucomicrobiae bacterium]
MTALSPEELSKVIADLNRLAHNLWWTWDQGAQEIFQELSPRCWQNLYHNAVAVLREVSDYELRVRLQDPEFAARVNQVLHDFESYMGDKDTWATHHAAALAHNPVAYFSAEFGFHETLPIAAGGLGILAGDHAKSASDLGIGFAGISLFYREGYFGQQINQDNWQTEYYTLLNPINLPLEPVLDAKGQPLVCVVEIEMTDVYFHAWRVNVGRNPVYLLDANRPENPQHLCDLSRRVYGGDNTMRIMQEMLLGIGGVRLLRALGVQPSVFHMNEGHAAFLTLELVREKLAAGLSQAEALAKTKQQCIFTTHTPVEAGHDRFNRDLVNYAQRKMMGQLKMSIDTLMGLGRINPKDDAETFCMTVLGLKLSRAANAVSELHGKVSRQMWNRLWPDLPVDQVPIGHITNGIHLTGWMKGPVRRFWQHKLAGRISPENPPVAELTSFSSRVSSAGLEKEVNSTEFWKKMADPDFISDEELWSLRYKLRRELIEFARRRLGQRLSQSDFIAFDQILNADALTIGFARRFATYKRAPLIFDQFDNMVKLINDRRHPIQFIFAGKAHPRDDDGKRYIQRIIHLSKFSELKGRLVFIENYDVHVARQMVSGCDIWLNNPRRPLEASGTSGQKAGCHGCLNMSIMDGWWREGYDGTNGFAIGGDSNPDSVAEQDRVDSANLYKVLTEQVIPTFYNRDDRGIPRQWLQIIRRAMVTLVPKYNTWRMVQDYTRNYYLPASGAPAGKK